VNWLMICEAITGTRSELNTDHAVSTQLVREAMPGRKPRWLVVIDLCNGVPDGTDVYTKRKDAMAAWQAEVRGVPEKDIYWAE